jgi:AMP-binding enzyme C-terminal domain
MTGRMVCIVSSRQAMDHQCVRRRSDNRRHRASRRHRCDIQTYRISPFELESALIEHAAVAEAAVVPSPHSTRLSVPKAFITLASGHDASRDTALSIFLHVRRHLSPFKRVRRIEFVVELPKTISGKIRRVQWRRAEERGDVVNWRGGVAFSEEDFLELQSARSNEHRAAQRAKSS